MIFYYSQVCINNMSCHIAKLGEEILRLEAKKVEDIKSQKIPNYHKRDVNMSLKK